MKKIFKLSMISIPKHVVELLNWIGTPLVLVRIYGSHETKFKRFTC